MKATHMNAHDLPLVDPMTIRRITPQKGMQFFGGVLVLDDFHAEIVGTASERLDFDEDVVDCSNRIFQLTTELMWADKPWALCAFPSRRWHSMREGNDITGCPDKDHPFLYLGNPVRVFKEHEGGIVVVRIPEFLIKSGVELGY